MARFCVRPEAIRGDRVDFDAEETRHLARVLRLGAGDLVHALDGHGVELTVRLTAVGSRSAAGAVVERAAAPAESRLRLTLAQGIPRGDKMESVIRMATELGAVRIAPLLTARTVLRRAPGGWEAKQRRWQRVAREGAKQCGRAVVPMVEEPRPLDEWLAEAGSTELLVCLWEDARAALAEVLPPDQVSSATLIVGPEGGLDETEVETLRRAGARVAGLGPRILRTETASPVGLALLQARYGDLMGSGSRARPLAPAEDRP